jgi:hypothetical protein
MAFHLYLKKSSYNPAPRNAIVREDAINAHVLAINQLRGGINIDFGVRDWVVVI